MQVLNNLNLFVAAVLEAELLSHVTHQTLLDLNPSCAGGCKLSDDDELSVIVFTGFIC